MPRRAQRHRRRPRGERRAHVALGRRTTPDADAGRRSRSIYDALAERLAGRARRGADADTGAGGLGWYGWFGYELGAGLSTCRPRPAETPDAAFLFVDRAIVFEHAPRTVRLEWLEDGAGGDELDRWADEPPPRLRAIEPVARGRTPATRTATRQPRAPPPAHAHRWRHDADGVPPHDRRVPGRDRARRRLPAVPHQPRRRRRDARSGRGVPAPAPSSPSHHGGFVRFDDVALLSASPEQFLHVERDGTVSTKPMKGTRPRSADPATDAALRAELSSSEKERAENLMIVDLMRNDLGRIAELGSVRVPSLLEVEEYPHVHQLVSTVTARLRHPLTALDAVLARRSPPGR